MFEGFATEDVPASDGTVFVRHNVIDHLAGVDDQAVVVLLHGHPRTLRHMAPGRLLLTASGPPVICPDLRGYGRSRGPAPTPDHRAHSKRASAVDEHACRRVPQF